MARVARPRSPFVFAVTRTINGREVISGFHARVVDATLQAGLVQARIMAEESRELILDKLLAATPQRPGQREVERPRRLRRREIPTVERRAFRHAPLAEPTVKDKAAREQDGRKLIATGAYIEGIEVFRGMRQGQPYYVVRPKPGQHPDAGVTHRVLAAFHEFGTSRMPARPHWSPCIRIVRRELRRLGPQIRAVAMRTAIRQAR